MVLNEIGIVSIASRSDESQSFLPPVQIKTDTKERNTPNHQTFQKKQVNEKIKSIEDTTELAIFLKNFKIKLSKPPLFFISKVKVFFNFHYTIHQAVTNTQ